MSVKVVCNETFYLVLVYYFFYDAYTLNGKMAAITRDIVK